MATSAQTSATTAPTPKRFLQITALAWAAMIGLDLFMNAGLLAPLYQWEQPGLLEPWKMFQYIPLGYASFLLWSVALVWLVGKAHLYGAAAGAKFGAKLGGLLGGATFLGWLSIFSFPPLMVFCWALDCAANFALAGAVIGAGFHAARLKPVACRVFALVALCVIVTVALQNIGYAPVHVRRS